MAGEAGVPASEVVDEVVFEFGDALLEPLAACGELTVLVG